MKKPHHLQILTAVIGAILFLASCNESGKEQTDSHKIYEPKDLNSKEYNIGVMQGSASMFVAEQFFNNANIAYYTTVADGQLALNHGKIDAFVFDRQPMEFVVKVDTTLAVLPEDIAEQHIVVGIQKDNNELQKEINQFISQYRADGTYQEMCLRWITDNPQPMPDILAAKDPVRKLRVGTDGVTAPMSYYGKDRQLTGYDIEFVKRLGNFLNAEIEITAMTFEALIPALESKKLDMVVASMNSTKERREKLLLSDDYIESAICVLIRKDRLGEKETSTKIISSVNDLQGKKIGVISGTTADKYVQDKLPTATPVYFNAFADLPIAMESHKIDAYIDIEPQLRKLQSIMPGLHIIPEHLVSYDVAFMFPKKEKELCEEFSSIIRSMKADGTIEKLKDKWLSCNEANYFISPTQTKAPRGVLKYATSGELEPFTFMKNGQVIGFDIETAQIIAERLGYKLEPVILNWSGYLDAVYSGKVRFGVGATAITEERKQRVLFSEPNYNGGLLAAVYVDPKKVNTSNGKGINSLKDLKGKRVGVISSSSADQNLRNSIPEALPVYAGTIGDMILSLETGKIDAFATNTALSKHIIEEKPSLRLLEETLSDDEYAFIFSLQEKELCDSFSMEIRKMKEEGILSEIEEKWLGEDKSKQIMPPPVEDAPKGILKYAVEPVLEPFLFERDGEIVGFDIEVAQYVAEKLGYKLEPVCTYGSYLEAVSSGKVRLGVGLMTITEERKQTVHFCEPVYRDGNSVVVLDNVVERKEGGIKEWFNELRENLSASFERTFIRENRWELILDGLKVTILITLLSLIVGTLLAFGVCFMRMSSNPLLSQTAKIYIALIQGMPILVILMILYYVIFAKVDIDAIIVAIIGFALNFAAYAGETFRSGLNSIPKGQNEAALALGFSKFSSFRKVILPQVIRHIMPVYRGEFVSMFKMTSVVGYIAIQDLTKMSDIIRSRTYEAFFPLIVTAIIYFVTAHLLASILTYVEYRLDPKNRRSEEKGEKGGKEL